jgi:hypothetical protein
MALILNMAVPDCSRSLEMDNNLGHKLGERGALGLLKELGRCVRAETGGRSEEVYLFPVRSSGFLLFEHQRGEVRADV